MRDLKVRETEHLKLPTRLFPGSHCESDGLPPFACAPVFCTALLLLILHLACADRYGYFRDELYYLSCAQRLSLGYVDQPPLSIFVLSAFVKLFGTSLYAVRAPMFLADCGIVWAFAEMTRRLGGGWFAQTVAALVYAAAPVFLVVGHLFAMNGFDVLLTALSILSWYRILDNSGSKEAGESNFDRANDLTAWAVTGLYLGLSLLNKLSVLWFIAALIAATLASSRRRILFTPGFLLAFALAGLISMPYWVWQWQNGWPTLEFARNASLIKMIPIPVWAFVATQAVVMNPVSIPVWASGIATSLVDPRKRPLAVSFLLIACTLAFSQRSRPNYLSPSFLLVIAPGAVVIARAIQKWQRPFAVAGVCIFWAAVAVICLPILPPERLEMLISASPVQPVSEEKGPKSHLQGLADMFGWEEMTRATDQAYTRLSAPDKSNAIVLASNYGEAAALDHFGKGLPRIASLHNQFWIWGPGSWDGHVALFVNLPPEFRSYFRESRVVSEAADSFAVPEERRVKVWLVRDLKMPVGQFWRENRKLQ